MKSFFSKLKAGKGCMVFILCTICIITHYTVVAQSCPISNTTTIFSNPDTYYPGTDASLSPGSTSITLGASSYGNTPVSSNDLLLVIQMQGAQIYSGNNSNYGDGTGIGSGYLNNAMLVAGTMEYVVASNSVPLSGGVLNIQSGLVNSYKNADYGTDGQYRFQVIRVGMYYNLILGASITAPAWNGKTGGVVVLTVTNNLNFNGQTITAAGAGFRGGAARQLNGGSGGSNTDFVTRSSKNYNGSKGEGIAGTPRFLNNNGTILDNGPAMEGYPNGSYASGAPANAGGGGTDGNPSSNDQNSGGGGGANAAAGGKGGNSWNSNLAVGGRPGSRFLQSTPSRFVMGGGGGAGTTNDGTGIDLAGFSSSGAAGGGIVMITAASITGTGFINVSGASGNITVLNDGSGGGGAGGSVLLFAGSGHSNIIANANGGSGGTNTGTGSPHGPGGGGSGGYIYSNAPLNAASTATGGAAGVTAANNNYGATAGTNGIIINNVTISQVPVQTLYCSVLPVNFLNINATTGNNTVLVNWQVTNETGVNNYVVEKSLDGNDFLQVGTVLYHASNNSINEYQFTDLLTHSALPVMYYRIKQVAVNGSFSYSKVVMVKTGKSDTQTGFNIIPNPARNNAVANFVSATATDIQLRLFSLNGTKIWESKYHASAGTNRVRINNLGTIPDGTYLLIYYNGTYFESVKVVVAH